MGSDSDKPKRGRVTLKEFLISIGLICAGLAVMPRPFDPHEPAFALGLVGVGAGIGTLVGSLLRRPIIGAIVGILATVLMFL